MYDGTDTFTVVLDDITTTGLHFSELLVGTKKPEGILSNGSFFINGENISIQAVAYSNEVLTSVAYSGEWTTNSLFGEVVEDVTTSLGITTRTAEKVCISNIRHLENLSDGISDVSYTDPYFKKTISAEQTVNLDWNEFITGVNGLKDVDPSLAINIYDSDNNKTKNNCYLPVAISPTEYALDYNGQSSISTEKEGGASGTITVAENHSITGIVVDDREATGEGFASLSSAGLFGSLTGASIKNLTLINTSIALTSENAGVLAGSLTGSTVENVLAYNNGDNTAANVTALNGHAGGLIGFINANTDLKKCAAAVTVSSTGGNAGGLVGAAGTLCSITGCYSGGHTMIDSGITGSDAVVYDPGQYNVTAQGESSGGIAGGLIGEAQATQIKYCYSTCSAKGKTAGGLVGTGSGAIKYSYCTGLVSGSNAEGAFIGSYTGSTGGWATDCRYFEIINEREEKDGSGNPTGGYTYLYPVNGSAEVSGISAFDGTASTFNEFSDPGTRGYAWQAAVPYNATLTKYYGEGSGTNRVARYNLRTVEQLLLLDGSYNADAVGALVINDAVDTETAKSPADSVKVHYGDWPAPEIFVINTK